MQTNIGIFEDEHFELLYPLTLTRPVYKLRIGISLLREKISRRFPNSRFHFFCRDYLVEVLRETLPNVPVNSKPKGNCLLINGRFILGEKLPTIGKNELVWKKNGEVAAAWVSETRLSTLLQQDGIIPTSSFQGLPEEEIEGTFVRYPWDLVHHNSEQIISDFAFSNRGGEIIGKIYTNVTLLEEKIIFISPGAEIKPGAVLDAENGPIFIGEGAIIMPMLHYRVHFSLVLNH